MGVDMNSGELPDVLSKLMTSPEIGNILSALKNDGEEKSEETGAFSLPPDFMEKLPSVMAALNGMGFGNSSPAPQPPKKSSGGQQRKALLKALRPYLSPKRQSVVDGLLSLDGLSGLFSNIERKGEN